MSLVTPVRLINQPTTHSKLPQTYFAHLLIVLAKAYDMPEIVTACYPPGIALHIISIFEKSSYTHQILAVNLMKCSISY